MKYPATRAVVSTACALLPLFHLAGCVESNEVPRFELRWCSNGESSCVLTQNEGSYVRGGYFVTLDRCNDAIKHLRYYGVRIGANCVELRESERKKLDRT